MGCFLPMSILSSKAIRPCAFRKPASSFCTFSAKSAKRVCQIIVSARPPRSNGSAEEATDTTYPNVRGLVQTQQQGEASTNVATEINATGVLEVDLKCTNYGK